MKTRTVTERIGEYLGPVDVNYDFRQHGHDDWVRLAWERLLKLTQGDWEATTDTGCPKFGWHKVLQVGMYDGWPHWKPVPSVCLAGTLGAEWHPFYSISGIEPLSECCKAKVIADYMGDPSVPGGTMSWPACSKCGEHIRNIVPQKRYSQGIT